MKDFAISSMLGILLLLGGGRYVFAAEIDASPKSATTEKKTTKTKPKLEAEIAVEQPASANTSVKTIELQESPDPVRIDYARRPAWVSSMTRKAGEIHTVSVSSDPWATLRECDEALEKKLQEQVEAFIAEHLRNPTAPHLIRFDSAYIKKNLVEPDGWFRESIVVSVGEMQQTHALLRFDDDFRAELDRRWNQIIATSRLAKLALGFCGVLVLLGFAYSVCKFKSPSNSGDGHRLQFTTVTTILACVALGLFLLRSIRSV